MNPSTETSGKPDDIPSDVWDKAENTLDLMLCNEGYEGARDDAIADIARAILAAKAEEREACAQVADEHSGPFAEGSIFGAGETFAANRIADAIRKRGGE